ncbi:uncharacterized protein LOC125235595 [Leguminivora glycinivorella]|uniref:uncharacterized protein LOC125235595 n=1 Tax=Leguminivora glycinivorella TaxID=1035111 RepID=UPI00200CC53F|nr:uncharacterized protein LOC125235595 [Leguminivora glycinivorella]
MGEERSRRLSQLFDPLARFTDHSGAGQSASTPNSPRLMPRRSRDPPPPPPRPVGQSRVDPLDFELDTELGSVNWQERCLELQLELHRSRHQATRVHHMLSEKASSWTIELGSVNWQERCLELQLELHRSRHQATRVHHMLSEKERCLELQLELHRSRHQATRVHHMLSEKDK